MPVSPDKHELERIAAVNHYNPHSMLGAHPAGIEGKVVVRAFHPTATHASVVVKSGAESAMKKIHPGGVFQTVLTGASLPLIYRVRFVFEDGSTSERVDPYRFLPTLGDLDLHLIGEGAHEKLYDKLGAHPRTIDGVEGTAFAVWAPNALRVSVVGAFNLWDGRVHAMRSLGSSGVWEIFLPGVKSGDLYKFEIKTKDGHLRLKTDPFAFRTQMRPENSSIVHEPGDYLWGDGEWIERRKNVDLRATPMSIYEVHLGSWMRDDWRTPTYREIAPKLAAHVKSLGFTHIELMPIQEHPLDESWGYQVTGYFAPTSRYGEPDDFKHFVDCMHKHGVGVLLDWVPAHFPKDDFSLRLFDGTPLYEHADPRMAEHPDWGSLIFNYGRKEVRNFLIANALFWLDRFHIDGLRVDAVASMIYLDYSRKEGEWVPNEHGGRENLDAISFLRKLNESVYGRFPGCFTVAEESTSFTGVTSPTWLGGLGFGFKWNMGWMHDTLRYFSKDPIHRKYHHNDLTFSMLYEYTENFINPLSHDEVVHGKGSLLNKMPGDEWQKFANLRLLLAYMFTRPGKKMLFMGAELAPWEEWNEKRGLDWSLLSDPKRAGLMKFLGDLGHLYLVRPELWLDHDGGAFQWIDCNDADGGVVSYTRAGGGSFLVVILNLTPVPRSAYRIGVPRSGRYRETINSDSNVYGGSNVGNLGTVEAAPIPSHGFADSLELTLPPLGALVLEPERG